MLVWIPCQYEDIMNNASEMYVMTTKDKWIFAKIKSAEIAKKVKIKDLGLKKQEG